MSLQIASTKLYGYHSVIINVIEINRNQSLIVINTKIWQNVVSLIDYIDESKNTKFTGLSTLLYGYASLIFTSNN